MENTIENKQKFFAQYWGQKKGKTDFDSRLWINENFLNSVIYLELKPLSSITDEDAIEVAIQNKFDNKDSEACKRMCADLLDWALNPQKYPLRPKAMLPYTTSDYLRSKGYAVPYNGLSVEKLIEYGWIKLQ